MRQTCEKLRFVFFSYQFLMYVFSTFNSLDVSLIMFTFYSYKHIIITADDVQTAQYLSLTNCYRTRSITLFDSQYKYQTKSTFQFHVSPTRSIEAKWECFSSSSSFFSHQISQRVWHTTLKGASLMRLRWSSSTHIFSFLRDWFSEWNGELISIIIIIAVMEMWARSSRHRTRACLVSRTVVLYIFFFSFVDSVSFVRS